MYVCRKGTSYDFLWTRCRLILSSQTELLPLFKKQGNPFPTRKAMMKATSANKNYDYKWKQHYFEMIQIFSNISCIRNDVGWGDQELY